jgi:cell division protein FtsQ
MNTLNRWLLWSWFVFLVAHGLAFILSNPRFGLHRLKLEGDLTHTQEASIRAHVLTRLSGNFFTLDLPKAQQAFETLPWVKTALVKRNFPDGLIVSLQEHEPAAYWQVQDKQAPSTQWLNTQGHVFETPSEEDKKDRNKTLPTLVGPPDSASQVLLFYEQLDPLFQKMASHIHILELTEHGSWRLQISPPGTTKANAETETGSGAAWVELGVGSPDELLPKVHRLVNTWPIAMTTMPTKTGLLASIDLRHHEGYALRWQNPNDSKYSEYPSKYTTHSIWTKGK